MRTKRQTRWALAAGLALALAGPAAAQEQSLPGGFSADQAQGIEIIVREYLLANPEILVEALGEYQKRQRVAEEQARQQAIVERHQALARDPGSPVLGNPDGDVLVVEFFDYRCPYCKKVAGMVRDEIASDGNVRLVMKEFPILGPQSLLAARAALAAVKQGKYEDFHMALMTEPGDMSEEFIEAVATKVGLDVAQLQKDMRDPEVEAILRRNFDLAEALGVKGTPAFVIGRTLVPGAIEAEDFRQLIAAARAKAS